ncbi:MULTISPECIES: sugar phosphate isomerase/epimerase family protein [Bacillus]|jgi:sugar phosphate isomerase/epimerase|uniref:sugar phosphate isomerase/epimerase family protein n=1 Tax=Bacillus TaxID=1386 RepID=UPI000B8BCF04|nr:MULTISPECIES: sugar phosphate isomerase/epimerase [Bacillus]MCW8784864.1 sugar phosphate isomerase/epimerase [Bacillus velezensis]MEC2240319.1 sugar phosphate isomerase/epimerase [Bacillus velezensis]NUI23524.1 sugar phosphate isomerase/epimerase [Bacillus amyloliquefaciens]NUI32511.1 sugar phosphate isomerase/epimerase [Bacillus amyloliquefaciens]NUI36217.1 sugar phosphate isomerase/epimerase [Bacillus amyloliquefaciens]
MKLSYVTDSLGHRPFEEMLDIISGMGIDTIEMTTGGWSSAPHLNLDELLESSEKRNAFKEALEKRNITLCALNCSGNPLDPGDLGTSHKEVTEKTLELAALLNVKKVIMMSGLPAASPDDKIPNWITYTVSWPPQLKDILDYQWEEVAIPYWRELVKKAESCGVEKIALENFSAQLVYNPETLFRLRNAAGPMVGLNLDPSHLIWMGADPIVAARELGEAIHHVHGKDVRIERHLAAVNGLLETKEVSEPANRAWNYVAVGCGKDLQWWKEFFSVVRIMGYDGEVSLEMEDLTMSPEAGIETSIHALQQSISR